MAFQVVFHPRARSDIAATVAWLARTSPAAAARWRTGLLRIIENLETDPNRYPAAQEAADLGVELRALLYGRRRNVHRVPFTIHGQTVNVLRVRHAAMDRLRPRDIESERKQPKGDREYCELLLAQLTLSPAVCRG